VEFPPQGLAEQTAPTGELVNPDFAGHVADYRDLAVRYATREQSAYTRFRGVMPGWDNTARRQNNSFCFENSSPGAFQAWLEEALEQTRIQNYGDERMVFVNAWNEWAEGAYLEPDRVFGYTFLEAVKNAIESSELIRKD
jgi:lipopolysaccharide biosynthesis protein